MTPRTTPSDSDLVRRIRKGEGAAVAFLRTRHASAVFDFSLRMTASVADARTITDQVFADALDAPPDLGDDDTFRSWAFATAHRMVMARPDALPVHGDDLGSDVAIVVDLRANTEPVDDATLARVWEAMSHLDRQTQAVIQLHL